MASSGLLGSDQGRAEGPETILVVEDQEDLREIFCELLQELGYVVMSAGSGRAALDIVKAHAGAIDLILTDIRMPEMDGPELAARAGALRPQVRVLYASGDGSTIAARGNLDRAVEVLQKPFSSVVLASAIRRALDLNRYP